MPASTVQSTSSLVAVWLPVALHVSEVSIFVPAYVLVCFWTFVYFLMSLCFSTCLFLRQPSRSHITGDRHTMRNRASEIRQCYIPALTTMGIICITVVSLTLCFALCVCHRLCSSLHGAAAKRCLPKQYSRKYEHSNPLSFATVLLLLTFFSLVLEKRNNRKGFRLLVRRNRKLLGVVPNSFRFLRTSSLNSLCCWRTHKELSLKHFWEQNINRQVLWSKN